LVAFCPLVLAVVLDSRLAIEPIPVAPVSVCLTRPALARDLAGVRVVRPRAPPQRPIDGDILGRQSTENLVEVMLLYRPLQVGRKIRVPQRRRAAVIKPSWALCHR